MVHYVGEVRYILHASLGTKPLHPHFICLSAVQFSSTCNSVRLHDFYMTLKEIEKMERKVWHSPNLLL